MTRREEVEAELQCILRKTKRPQLAAAALCRTLADEVDALRAEADPDALTICYMQGRAAGRDAEREIVTKLLAMLKPGERPNQSTYATINDFTRAVVQWEGLKQFHVRAIEIAGRTE